MKRLLLIAALLGLILSLAADETQAPAAKPKQVQAMGASAFGSETIESIESMGLVKLKGTTVSYTATVSGSLIAQGAVIGTLSVVGEAHLTDTRVKEGGSILGYVQAHNSTIEQPLSIQGQKAVFVSCKLKGITVRTPESFKGKQVIELRQKTIVDGPITFESGKGEIYLYPGAQILGPVNGGKIVKKG